MELVGVPWYQASFLLNVMVGYDLIHLTVITSSFCLHVTQWKEQIKITFKASQIYFQAWSYFTFILDVLDRSKHLDFYEFMVNILNDGSLKWIYAGHERVHKFQLGWQLLRFLLFLLSFCSFFLVLLSFPLQMKKIIKV